MTKRTQQLIIDFTDEEKKLNEEYLKEVIDDMEAPRVEVNGRLMTASGKYICVECKKEITKGEYYKYCTSCFFRTQNEKLSGTYVELPAKCQICKKNMKNSNFINCYTCNMKSKGKKGTPCKSCGKEKDNFYYNCYTCNQKKGSN